MPLPSVARSHGTKKVVIIRNEGTDDEERAEVEAMIQASAGYFDVKTPIYEGDVVEVPDPRGGIDRRLAQQVDVNDYGSRSLQHIKVTWGKAPAPRAAPVRRLSIERMHQDVIAASGDLFADGHYYLAVAEAFKSVEVRVRVLAESEKSGAQLMGEAFGGKDPRINVATFEGRSGQDEQEGFQALFRGSMMAVRNPKAHELIVDEDPVEALEYLGFASLLHRRLDRVDA